MIARLKNAFGRMFKALPKWAWAVIAIFVLLVVYLLLPESGEGYCYYDNWGEEICP